MFVQRIEDSVSSIKQLTQIQPGVGGLIRLFRFVPVIEHNEDIFVFQIRVVPR